MNLARNTGQKYVHRAHFSRDLTVFAAVSQQHALHRIRMGVARAVPVNVPLTRKFSYKSTHRSWLSSVVHTFSTAAVHEEK